MSIFLATLDDLIWQMRGGIILLAALALLAQLRTRASRGDRRRPGRCRERSATGSIPEVHRRRSPRSLGRPLHASASSTVTSTVKGPTRRASITANHGQTSMVFLVAWSPDGTRIVSGSDESTVQVCSDRVSRTFSRK